ncbi:MAG: rRNA maturation RNase YbeY [Candidatus Omnitrophota bacterium]
MKNKSRARRSAVLPAANNNLFCLTIAIKNLQKTVPLDPDKIKEIAFKVFQREGVEKKAALSFFFVTDKKIQALNLRYLGEDCPTDVIAFDSSRGEGILADIFISTDRAAAQSAVFKTSLLYELYLYLIHGILHVLGYDDLCSKERALMRKREKLLLKELNITRNT